MTLNELKSVNFTKYLPDIPAFNLNFLSLFIALIALSLSFAAIFIKLSEQEIGPIATIFNRLWIAAIVLGAWNWMNRYVMQSPSQDHENRLPKKMEVVLLILVGICGTASVVFWALSLTQTSVANSTLMRNLFPIFTCLQGWLFFQQKFNIKFLVGSFKFFKLPSICHSFDGNISCQNFPQI